jgi:aquaporin Z
MHTPQLRFLITALPRSASLREAFRVHWREYLMEATEMGALMFAICFFATSLYSSASPLAALALPNLARPFLMGAAVALATFLIIRSPFGRRTGAHFNPAITLTYFFLGRVHRWDALFYMAFQFVGSLLGVFFARQLLGDSLSSVPVCYAVTTPGTYGSVGALGAEFLLSALLMGIVLFSTNHKTLVRFSPVFVSLITIFYYGLCSSLSGISVNPARSFSSAFFAQIWQGIWVYFAAPGLGMLAAASLYARFGGRDRIYCAKVFHDTESICPFFCRFEQLLCEDTKPGTREDLR